jgi:hypothetical protein
MIVILMLLAAVVVSSVVARAAPGGPASPLRPDRARRPNCPGPPTTYLHRTRALPAPVHRAAPVLDGWRIPREGLTEDWWTICALALGLVLFTVLGADYFIHWMIPSMPLAVAFALAGLLSPTDAVALSAIAKHAPVPKRLIHVFEGEALLNDASGLVCMRFAVAAVLTGSFSIVEASGTILWLAGGGVVVGAAVALGANTGKDWVSQRFGEETGSQIPISLLIPLRSICWRRGFRLPASSPRTAP